jgi:metal-responsive CopG/Arc/MetJ family transcriptional regulator
MASISLNLPDDLAQESTQVAERIGVSRTELIRQALRHELDDIEARFEREAMAAALATMRSDETYRQDARAIEEGLTEGVTEETDDWWRG